jgi:hypothetical protein
VSRDERTDGTWAPMLLFCCTYHHPAISLREEPPQRRFAKKVVYCDSILCLLFYNAIGKDEGKTGETYFQTNASQRDGVSYLTVPFSVVQTAMQTPAKKNHLGLVIIFDSRNECLIPKTAVSLTLTAHTQRNQRLEGNPDDEH